jgi:iron complex outermembrane receptor protein
MLSRTLLLSTVAAVLLASAGSAAAADADAAPAVDNGPTLDTVVVTARRVEENLQTVPATVTAVSADQLRKQNIVSVVDLATITPSLSIASYFNALNDRFAVRGLTAGVTTYFADAPCCGGIASAPFMDIASTQVLNGPQGTLFGRSSAAGAVLIYPQRPILNEYGGLIDVTVGDYGRAQFTGVANLPIIKDHLAIRLAVNSNHVNGYTTIFDTSHKLDDIQNQQYRLGVEFKAGNFENYLAISYLNVDQSATSLVLAAANPNLAIYNPTAASGVATFGAVCASAVSLGYATDANSCIAQRVGTLQAIKQRLIAEQARQDSSKSAARSTYPSYDGQIDFSKERHASAVNVTEYHFGNVGPVKLDVKNIFSYDSFVSDVSGAFDGVGGVAEEGAFANAFYSNFGANNESGNRLTPALGPSLKTYTEEFQVHADVAEGLVKATAGVFYQDQSAPKNNFGGTTNVYKLYSGVLNPNLGYNNAVGFIVKSTNKESAWYSQGTLDLSKWGVHGLSLTGGYRYSWDQTSQTTLPAVINNPSGVFTPGATPTTTGIKSRGYNYTFSIAEQINDKLMVYATASRAYVPGGVNALGQAAASLPNFTPTYGAETVKEQEIGFKAEFELAGVVGRLNADVYNNDFANITEQLTGLIGGTSVRYLENIAGARLRGFEMAGTLIPNRDWIIGFGYSYNDAKYTSWTGSDPFNIARPGNPLCVSSSPAGLCYLDLTNNPFPYMPKNQGHVTVTYFVPVNDQLGNISLAATVYAQSREYYEATAARDLQLLPSGLNGVSQAPYTTLNLRAEWTNVNSSGWNVAAFVNNATDKLYAAGKTPQLETLGFAVANYAPPRMVGIQVWKKFGGL